jgi:RNA polymerase sigma-70 factor (ECF subfamily)
MENVNDFFYVRRIKAGDSGAFKYIVYKYQKTVLTIVMKIVENKEDAEDITQEIFIKVFKSLEYFREKSAFSTWLYRIAYNTTLSELRKRKLPVISMEDNLPVEDETITEEFYQLEEKLYYLEKALKRLAPEESFLITLYYLDEQTIENISQVTNLSISNVKIKLHRIRKKLALEINKLLKDENR